MFKVNDIINDQYEVRGWAQGGMGRVYFTMDQVTHDYRVIKMIRADLKDSREACDRFEQEANAWINLGVHPSIVRALSFQRVPIPILLEELIQGPSLHQLIRKEGPLAIAQAIDFAIHVGEGLLHAHNCPMPKGNVGIIHRDLKPQNILITRQCRAKIADFGLAKVIDPAKSGSGHVVGTAHYMPPEQLKGRAKPKSDLYSLGVTLYEMITGHLPFQGTTFAEVSNRILNDEPIPIWKSRPDVPARLLEFIKRCMEKQTKDRPAKAQTVLRELRQIRDSLPTSDIPECARCGYLARTTKSECPVCGPALAFPNAHDVRESSTLPPPPVKQPETWECPSGHAMQLVYAFCLECGSPRDRERICPNCQASNSRDYAFCQHCGHEMGG